jgi:hypothetical protein
MPARSYSKHRRYWELAFREADGVSVRLYWNSLDDELFARVNDHCHGDDFVLDPPKHEALSAFHHPYALRPSDSSGPSRRRPGAQLEV